MFGYFWPILLVVSSNTLYHICAKSAPGNVNPFASLTVTYLVSALTAAVMCLITSTQGSAVKVFGELNWTSVAVGFFLVALETGWIYVYRAGWQVSVASIVQSTLLSLILMLVGFLVYKEAMTWNKIVGIIICLIGLGFINIA